MRSKLCHFLSFSSTHYLMESNFCAELAIEWWTFIILLLDSLQVVIFMNSHWTCLFLQKRACEHVVQSERRNMFASAQCLGYYLDHGLLTKELCYPPKETVLNQIKKEVKKRKVKAIFVATDSDDMKADIVKVTKVCCLLSFSLFCHLWAAEADRQF